MTWPDYDVTNDAQAQSVFQSAAAANLITGIGSGSLSAVGQLQLAVTNLLLGDSPVSGTPADDVSAGTFGASTPSPGGNYVFPAQLSFGTLFYSTAALATPSALAATAFNAFASTVSGATLMGFGTTHDVALKMRDGTTVAGVLANSPILATIGNTSGVGGALRLMQQAASGVRNWQIESGRTSNAFTITPSTAADGTTFSTAVLTINSGGVLSLISTGALTIGTAVAGAIITNAGTVTATGGVAYGKYSAATLVAAANSDVLTGINIVPTHTPASFTGLVARGLNVAAFSVAGFTTPGNPVGINVGVITGTGASVATALQLAPPTGATTNYLLAHSTAATFNVTAAGAITTTQAVTSGTAGSVAQLINGAAGGATTAARLVKVVTGISDNTATTVLTITVPNVAAGATVRVTLTGIAGASGAIGAYEDVDCVSYDIAVARTVGVAMAAVASSAYGAGAAAVVGAGTMTCVAAITLNGEGVGSTNTASFKVTIDQSSTSTLHRCLVSAEVLNDAAGGVTIS